MKYVVRTGDTLTGIAKKHNINFKKLLRNNTLIKDINNIRIGDIINIPETLTAPDYYIVKQGDYLGKIANMYGYSLLELTKYNNIDNANSISIGLRINFPKGQVPQVRSLLEIKDIEKEYNKESDKDLINHYHLRNRTNRTYIIDDKLNNELGIYKNGILIKKYKAIHGKNRDLDEMTITKVDPETGKIINKGGNMSTPAGLYFTTQTSDYHGAPAFMRRTEDMVKKNNPKGIPSSIHARTITESANTNGCTGVSVLDLKDMEKYLEDSNIETYILPANSNNRFFIRNNTILFKSSDISKTPSYNTIVNKPIHSINVNTDGLDANLIQIINSYKLSLIDNKQLLLKDLKINNDTYNQLSLYALGIVGAETNYGDLHSSFGNFLRAVNKGLSKLFGFTASSPDYKSKYYTYKGNSDNNSIGLTLLRISQLNDRLKELLKKYEISKDDLVDSPEKAAIATMIVLSLNYKDRGLNFDRAISGWNNASNYVNRVKKNSLRFTINELYRLGGLISNRRLHIIGLKNYGFNYTRTTS